MPISLKSASGGSGSGIALASGNILNVGIAANFPARSGNVLTVSGVDISSPTITTMISINAPANGHLLLRKLTLSGLTSTSSDLGIELEIDGVVCATQTLTASVLTGVTVLGNASTGTQELVNDTLQDIIVRSNFTLRVRKTPATAASATLTYIKARG